MKAVANGSGREGGRGGGWGVEERERINLLTNDGKFVCVCVCEYHVPATFSPVKGNSFAHYPNQIRHCVLITITAILPAHQPPLVSLGYVCLRLCSVVRWADLSRPV